MANYQTFYFNIQLFLHSKVANQYKNRETCHQITEKGTPQYKSRFSFKIE